MPVHADLVWMLQTGLGVDDTHIINEGYLLEGVAKHEGP